MHGAVDGSGTHVRGVGCRMALVPLDLAWVTNRTWRDVTRVYVTVVLSLDGNKATFTV